MSFKYFDIPMFALNDEAEVDYLLKVSTGMWTNLIVKLYFSLLFSFHFCVEHLLGVFA